MTNRNDIERLFKVHYAQMYRMAAALLHDDDLARDIVQDVFVRLLEFSPGVIVTGTYLVRAVRNRCLNHIRDCELHSRIAHDYLIDCEDYDAEEWPDEEVIGRINRLIGSSLSPQARRAMELRFGDGLSSSRTARIMGISENAVYRHLRNALSVIRQKLKDNG